MTERAQIDVETLIAYADGELSGEEARRVEAAIAEDPSLREQIAAHRKMRAMLANGFSPTRQATSSARLARLLDPTMVDDIANRYFSRIHRRRRIRWTVAAVFAACLVAGIVLGVIRRESAVEERDGVLRAAGRLARALDTQLASGRRNGAPVRVVATFRGRQGELCRAFVAGTMSGIGCRNGTAWHLRSLHNRKPLPEDDLSSSPTVDPSLAAEARAMMATLPLDAAAEDRARANGWQ